MTSVPGPPGPPFPDPGVAVPEPPRPPFPGFGAAVLLVILVHVIANTVAALFYAIRILMTEGFGGLESLRDVDSAALGIATNSLAFGAVTWWAWRRSAFPAPRVFPLKPVPVGLWGPMLLSLAGGLLVVNELSNLLLEVLPVPEVIQELFEQFLQRGPTGFIFLVIVAPVTEELLFRGVFLSSFRPRYGTGRAIAGTAVLFGLIHILPWQIVPAFFLGALFAWWTLECGSLWPALLGHAATNGMAFIQSMDKPAEEVFDIVHQPAALNLLGLALLLAGIVWSMDAFGRRAEEMSGPERSIS